MLRATGKLIGTAIEISGAQRRVQQCFGTYRGDFPDPRFRFNILFVEHAADFPEHGHEYAELVLVLAGSARHTCGEIEHAITAGDVFVIHRHQHHAFRDPRGLKLCNIQFDPRQMLAGQRDLHDMMGFHALFDLEPARRADPGCLPLLRLSKAQLAHALALATDMKGELDQRREGRETMIRASFLLLVAALSRYYAAAAQPEPTPVVRMASVLSHIRRHLAEPLSIDDLARIAHLSTSQFQRSFKKTYGETPVRLINRLRLERACELLRDMDRDITTIAHETGFATASFFATQFRRFTGQSPSEFRRQHAAGGDETSAARLRYSPAAALLSA